MEFWSIDRLEGSFAVCEGENRQRKESPLADLPEGVKEGDVLRLADGMYQIDREETERRREENRRLLESLLGE